MTFSPMSFTAPSGSFVSTAGYERGDLFTGSAFLPIYNPTVLGKYPTPHQIKAILKIGSDEWSRQIKRHSSPITDKDFAEYGEKLIELTHRVDLFKPHCSLGPLRGASKPCVMVEVMSRSRWQYEFFNFQQGSEKKNHPRILSDLTEILIRNAPSEQPYRINITDTARGGNGINALVSLLLRLKQENSGFRNQLWKIDINLFCDRSPNTKISNIQSVLRSQKPGEFEIDLELYRVSNLIVEDFDPALAFNLELEGQRHIFKPCSVPGQFLYQVGSEVQLVQSEDCYLSFEILYSKAITEVLLASNEHEQSGVVWDEYQQK